MDTQGSHQTEGHLRNSEQARLTPWSELTSELTLAQQREQELLEDYAEDPDIIAAFEYEQQVEAAVVAVVNYQPFEAAKEFKDSLYHATSRMQGLDEFRQALGAHEANVGHMIHHLHDTVIAAPDTPFDELWGRVTAAAQEYKLTTAELTGFYIGLERYAKRHETVRQYRTRYLDDAELFKALMTFPPQGQVAVIQGPMTLMIDCHDIRDYIAVYATTAHPTEKDVQKAALTGGVALSLTPRDDNLIGVVTARNRSTHEAIYQSVEVDERKEILPGALFAFSPEQVAVATVIVGGYHWRLAQTRSDAGTDPTLDGYDASVDLQLSNPESGATLLDCTVAQAMEVSIAGSSSWQSHIDIPNLVGSGVQLWIDTGAVQFRNHTNQPMQTRYQGKRFLPVANQLGLEATRVHEDQHQFNKLFYAATDGTPAIVADVASRNLPVPEAIDAMVTRLARRDRYSQMDQHAVDEILAYTQGAQHTPNQIFETLSQSPSYNYREHNSPNLTWESRRFAKDINDYMALLPNGTPSSAEELSVDPAETLPIVERVFGPEYEKDLRRWCDAVGSLLDKGYSHGEVVSLLYPHLPQQWFGMARRAQPKVTA